MIELLKEDYPDDVLAIEAVGKITAEDYRNILIPEANRRIEKHKTIRLLCILGTRFEGLTPGAAWSDLKFGVSRWNQFGRLAVVTDAVWIRDAILLFAPIYHHPVRVFPNSEVEVAKAWILETDEHS